MKRSGVTALFSLFLLFSCSAEQYQGPDSDIIITCRPPEMVLINHKESGHPVKTVYLHKEFDTYKHADNIVATDLAIGARTDPFPLCATNGCGVDRYITYTREKMIGSVETIAVTTETVQSFTCETLYTVYLLGENFLITKGDLSSGKGDDSEVSDDDDLL
jgi:hypothetical protein